MDERIRSVDGKEFRVLGSLLRLRCPLFASSPQRFLDILAHQTSNIVEDVLCVLYVGLSPHHPTEEVLRSLGIRWGPNEQEGVRSAMLKLYITGAGYDFVIRSCGREFKVHSFVMCGCCGFFHDLMESGCMEAEKGEFTDTKSDSGRHMEIFLRFCYGGVVEVSSLDDCMSLVSLGEFYGLEEDHFGEMEENVVGYIIQHCDEKAAAEKAGRAGLHHLQTLLSFTPFDS